MQLRWLDVVLGHFAAEEHLAVLIELDTRLVFWNHLLMGSRTTRGKSKKKEVAIEARARRGPRGRELGPEAGWPPDDRERRDFLHRPRSFPGYVGTWRKHLINQTLEGASLLSFPRGSDREGVSKRLDDGIAHIRELSRILALVHGTPRLGNPEDPVDELVYIILSRKTREGAYQEAFHALKDAFDTWDDLLAAPARKVTRLIHSGGLSAKKTESLLGALSTLVERFGSCTLEPVRTWSDEELGDFLCSLPEISRKSAYCIMMYSLGREVFPVDTHVGRILARIGPYSELGLDLNGLDHKKLQKVLDDLIPPSLRYPLHVNLVAHGRSTCKARNPLCGQCAVRKLCSTYRKEEVTRVSVEEPDTVDLFCGAGGLSLGFQRAGFRTSLALDSNPAAINTYKLNHPSVPDDRVLCKSVEDLENGELLRRLRRKKPTVLLGAPPCQGFSNAGFRSKATRHRYFAGEDGRNDLFTFVLAAAVELKPRLVLLENVPGMHSAKKGMRTYMEEAARYLEEAAGYRTEIWKLNAVEFGVPQDRNRMFLVASRMKTMPFRPPPEYQNRQSSSFDLDALPPITLEEAIFDLPHVGPGEGEGVAVDPAPDLEEDRRTRRYLRKFDLVRRTGVLFNHNTRYHNDRDLELYRILEPGEDSVHAIARHGRDDLMRYRADVFDDKYMKLRPDMPCKTIVSHLAKDGNGYIHPYQSRSLTLREAARVQSFPDDHPFCGSASEQWIQLGNAVPPVMAAAIAKSFLRTLETEKCR